MKGGESGKANGGSGDGQTNADNGGTKHCRKQLEKVLYNNKRKLNLHGLFVIKKKQDPKI